MPSFFKNRTGTASLIVVLLASCSMAQDPDSGVRPIPVTRPEMKQLLEDVKQRTPRIPLPELTVEERHELGERSDNYEARLRYHYLANGRREAGSRSTGFGRSQDPRMTLDYGFKVELFWIVSRTNNCQYCLGHQESKLLGAGRSEDRIAALDGDWSEFTEGEQAAYRFARKFTFEPHLLSEQDIDQLNAHFSDLQILEMILSMSWNNSINRWKEGVGVPQNPGEGGYSRLAAATSGEPIRLDAEGKSLPQGSYLTPTGPRFQKAISRVAPIIIDELTGTPTTQVISQRPALEDLQEVHAQWLKARTRTARLPLVDARSTRELFELAPSTTPVPNWLRLLANFPEEGLRRGNALLEAESNSDLSPLLKAQLAWIVARQDRAWYALGQAAQRLNELWQGEAMQQALDGNGSEFSVQDRQLFLVAKNLAASPVILSDLEVAEALETAGAAAVVQTIQYVTQRAAFNRLTEAAGLPLE